MPATTLKVNDFKLMIITSPTDRGTYVEVYDLKEDNTPSDLMDSFEVGVPEEEYHKGLRRDASQKGHYVPERSTDPEWNP